MVRRVRDLSVPTRGELAQIYGIVFYQFGRRAAEAFLERSSDISVSRYSSGILREVRISGSPVLYHNPKTGTFTLSWSGALMIFPLVPADRRRIYVKRAIFEEHVKRTLLAPAVAGCTEDIRAGDEIFLVDEGGSLLALGKALASAAEIRSMRRGKVALVRRSADELQED